MKKQKLSLDQLKVNSFVTGLDLGKKQTAKGGGGNGSSPYTLCCFQDDTNTCTQGIGGCDTEWTSPEYTCDF